MVNLSIDAQEYMPCPDYYDLNLQNFALLVSGNKSKVREPISIFIDYLSAGRHPLVLDILPKCIIQALYPKAKPTL